MPVSISGSGSITGVSSLTQLTKLGVTGILTATDFSGPSGGAADFPNGLTATTASFSSNLSVGGNLTVDGVLTYDDVTNIDSVGVITARAGVKIPDNQKIQLGTGNDLEIYHDGSNSVIKDNGTGKLILDTDGTAIEFQKQGLETIATFNSDGAIELYHNNSKKFETTSTGILVTGDITPTGYIQIDDSSSGGNLYIGNSSDLKLFHNGTSNYIRSGASNAPIHFDNNSGVLGARFVPAGAFELYHNGNKRVETTNTGASVTGNLNISGHTYLNDNRELVIGAGQDLKLYHNATANYIDNTSDLYVRVNGSETAIYATANGKVALNYDSANRFETTSTGVKVNGDAEVTGSIGIGTDDPETSIKLDVRGAVIGNSFGSSLLVTPSNVLTPSWTTVSSGSDPSSVPSGLVSVSVDPVLSQGTSLQIFLDLGVSVNSVTFDFNAVLDTNFYYPGWKVSNNGSSWTNKGAVNTDSNGVITLTDSNPFRYVALRSLTNYNGGTIATVESTTTTPSASEPDTNTKINFPASDTVAVETGGTERLRITSTGSVGISSTAPKTDVDISQKTGAVALPQGTTAQRPSGSAPYIRKNTTNNALEYFDGTSWVEIITDYFPTGSTILG